MDTDALTSTTYRREVETLESAGFVVIPPERAAGVRTAAEEVERLRARTHEIQERADKAIAALTSEVADLRLRIKVAADGERQARARMEELTGRYFGSDTNVPYGMCHADANAVASILKDLEDARAALRGALDKE